MIWTVVFAIGKSSPTTFSCVVQMVLTSRNGSSFLRYMSVFCLKLFRCSALCSHTVDTYGIRHNRISSQRMILQPTTEKTSPKFIALLELTSTSAVAVMEPCGESRPELAATTMTYTTGAPRHTGLESGEIHQAKQLPVLL